MTSRPSSFVSQNNETAAMLVHLPLPEANINSYFSLRAKCWLGGRDRWVVSPEPIKILFSYVNTFSFSNKSA